MTYFLCFGNAEFQSVTRQEYLLEQGRSGFALPDNAAMQSFYDRERRVRGMVK